MSARIEVNRNEEAVGLGVFNRSEVRAAAGFESAQRLDLVPFPQIPRAHVACFKTAPSSPKPPRCSWGRLPALVTRHPRDRQPDTRTIDGNGLPTRSRRQHTSSRTDSARPAIGQDGERPIPRLCKVSEPSIGFYTHRGTVALATTLRAVPIASRSVQPALVGLRVAHAPFAIRSPILSPIRACPSSVCPASVSGSRCLRRRRARVPAAHERSAPVVAVRGSSTLSSQVARVGWTPARRMPRDPAAPRSGRRVLCDALGRSLNRRSPANLVLRHLRQGRPTSSAQPDRLPAASVTIIKKLQTDRFSTTSAVDLPQVFVLGDESQPSSCRLRQRASRGRDRRAAAAYDARGVRGIALELNRPDPHPPLSPPVNARSRPSRPLPISPFASRPLGAAIPRAGAPSQPARISLPVPHAVVLPGLKPVAIVVSHRAAASSWTISTPASSLPRACHPMSPPTLVIAFNVKRTYPESQSSSSMSPESSVASVTPLSLC
ncbi:hypothetical protein AURDEDRAFT_174705 [Auricularia subglabra TFB-10046 SS5]|nr:hypothetical protein AURDEDRAFT_174705 [Auricularia subglabra TFB-10046 SS5]